MRMLACSDTYYVLKMYIYEGVRNGKSSGRGVGYDVIVQLTNMANICNHEHILCNDILFVPYNAANLLLNGAFMTGIMRQNQLKDLPAAIVNEKTFERWYRKDN